MHATLIKLYGSHSKGRYRNRKGTYEEEDFHQEREGDGRGEFGVTEMCCINV